MTSSPQNDCEALGADKVLSINTQILIFLHMPKTAGGTVSKYLYSHPHFVQREDVPFRAMDGDYNYGIYHYPRGFFKLPPDYASLDLQAIRHAPKLRAVIGHFSYGVHRLLPGPARYIAIVRDPVERIASLYSHLRVEGCINDIGVEQFVRECPVEPWLDVSKMITSTVTSIDEHAIRQAARTMVDNDQVRRITGQEPALGECSPTMLESAKDIVRKHFQLLGTTERLDESMLLLSRHLGSQELPRFIPYHVNRSRVARQSLTSRDLAAIAERNSLDAELWAFANELLDERIAAAGPEFWHDLELMRSRNEEFRALNATRIVEQGIG
jgi:hypothetical protein